MAQSGIKFQHVFLKPEIFQKIMIKMNEDSVFLVVNDYKLYNRPTFKGNHSIHGCFLRWGFGPHMKKISHPGMCTSPKLNMFPEKGPFSKGQSIFQSSIIGFHVHEKSVSLKVWQRQHVICYAVFLNKQLHTKR